VQLASCWIYWGKPKPQELACPNAGNAAASDHRHLGIQAWGHAMNLVRFEQRSQQKKRIGKTDLLLMGSLANRAELLTTGNQGSDQSP
jgi:hypothetical protein